MPSSTLRISVTSAEACGLAFRRCEPALAGIVINLFSYPGSTTSRCAISGSCSLHSPSRGWHTCLTSPCVSGAGSYASEEEQSSRPNIDAEGGTRMALGIAERIEDGEPVVDWRRDELIRAGYKPGVADDIAVRRDIDLHDAVALKARGCPSTLAWEILR